MHILISAYFLIFLLIRHASEVGLVLFAILGVCTLIVPSMRLRAFSSIAGWQRQDSLIALALSSVFIFKLLSSSWSASPQLGLKNALWHVHFAAWPLVTVALMYCKPKINHVLTSLALSIAFTGAWTLTSLFAGKPAYYSAIYKINSGVLAEVVFVCGTMLLVAATTYSNEKRFWCKGVYLFGVTGALIVLYSTHRRTEWIGFFIVVCSLGAWHLSKNLTIVRFTLAFLLFSGLIFGLFYFRQERFLTAYNEIIQYFSLTGSDSGALTTSVGIRMEIYRLGIKAFLDNPLFGMGSGVRPFLLQAYGGPEENVFPHRHFHSEFLQTLVEGGLVWATLLFCCVGYWFKKAVFGTCSTSPMLAIMAAYLSISFMLSGSVSAGLIYGPANASLVMFSALIWVCIRQHKMVS